MSQGEPMDGVISWDGAFAHDLPPQQAQECIGVWVFGPPGCGKSTVCLALNGLLGNLCVLIDSDQAVFDEWRGLDAGSMALAVEAHGLGFPGRIVLASCVEPPLINDRWLVIGIDCDIRDAMARKPGAYDIWGRQQGDIDRIRAIDSWRAACKPDAIFSGTPEEIATAIHAMLMERTDV